MKLRFQRIDSPERASIMLLDCSSVGAIEIPYHQNWLLLVDLHYKWPYLFTSSNLVLFVTWGFRCRARISSQLSYQRYLDRADLDLPPPHPKLFKYRSYDNEGCRTVSTSEDVSLEAHNGK